MCCPPRCGPANRWAIESWPRRARGLRRWRSLRGGCSQSMGDRVLAQAVARFSKMALIAVGVIVATGTFQAWLEVGSWEGLVQTAYGLSVTIKIALLALMLALAAFHLLIA